MEPLPEQAPEQPAAAVAEPVWATANVCNHRHNQIYCFPHENCYTSEICGYDFWISGPLSGH